MTKYIGLTIGPLVKTMTHPKVKKTREIWGASYIFSYIMKNMVKSLKDAGCEFIIPNVDDESIFDVGKEIGIFHDRFILKAKDGDYEKVGEAKEKVLQDLVENIAKAINKDTSKIKDFLDNYFQVYYCEIELESEEYKKANEKVNQYLDTLELQSKFIKEEKENYLLNFFNEIKGSFLYEDAYQNKDHDFLSIPKMAKQGTKTKDYIAIVQADGDNLGSTIKNLENNEDFKKVSKILLNFSKTAHEEIKKYGGTTIFAGGDDLLFFAPVVNDTSNVFKLVEELGKTFSKLFKNQSFPNAPTLSAGISITYIKYPMAEALQKAADLLFDKAKDEKMGKNAIAYAVRKHSGQTFTGVFNRNDADYKSFIGLINQKTDDKMLSSVIHKLNFHQALISEIVYSGDKEMMETKLKNYFDNFFNEAVHKKDDVQEFLNNVRELLQAINLNEKRIVKSNNDKEKEEKAILIDSVLRLKKFMGGEND